jgi:hypothetical protein
MRLLDYLEHNYAITPLEALSILGIYRLSDTVFQLRKDGKNIVTHLVNVTNKFGEVCRVAEYRLED